MGRDPTISRADLIGYFERGDDSAERVGLEIELGIVDPLTGHSIGYYGSSGAETLLRMLCQEFDGCLVYDDAAVVGVGMPDGSEFSLETGGALEYSSPPMVSLADVARSAREKLERAGQIGRRLGIALLSGANLPFTPTSEIPWPPKPRIQVMRDYFSALGPEGAYADEVMGLTLSTQTTLDYLSEEDLLEKLRLHVAASPVVAALCVNSPVADASASGAASRRMQFWRRFDPRRCGVLTFGLDSRAGVAEIVDWAAGLPMIYRNVDGVDVSARGRTFAEALAFGFADGTWPSISDWKSQLSQVWPHVRIRRTLELRAADGLPWPHFAASSALWIGLTYDVTARRRAIDLLAAFSAADLDKATVDVAQRGLNAMLGRTPVHELAVQLVQYADDGLSALVRLGREPAEVRGLLQPLLEVAQSQDTFADRCLNRWNGELGQSAARYVAAYQIP